MSRRLIAVGLVLATVLTACNGNLSKEREKQLQDSFAAVMSNKDAELDILLLTYPAFVLGLLIRLGLLFRWKFPHYVWSKTL